MSEEAALEETQREQGPLALLRRWRARRRLWGGWQPPLWMAVVGLCLLALLTLGGNLVASLLPADKADQREQIVVWSSVDLGDDVYTLVHQFELDHPEYDVVIGNAVARDLAGDAQRLLSAVAGGVPPDLVWFDRFAIGEWASRGALTDLRPMLAAQDRADPDRIDIGDYYPWAVDEVSYAPPGKPGATPGLFGIPTFTDVRLLFTNSDFLRQEGMVDASGQTTPPTTWDDLLRDAVRLTRFERPGEPASGIRRLGFAPKVGNSWLYLYAFEAGGNFLSRDGTKITLDSPPVVRALDYMTEVYDSLGGVAQVDAMQSGFQAGALDPFLTGQVAMKIEGNTAMATIADYRPGMDFRLTLPPMPADQLALGRKPVTWSGGFAWVVPATSQHKSGAFKLLQYLSSWEATQLLERGRREARESEGRIYLPSTLANREQFARLVRSSIEENPDVPETFRKAYKVIQEGLENTRIRPVTPVGQLLWNEHVRATDAATNHAQVEAARRAGIGESQYALRRSAVDVQRQLDRVLEPPPPHVVTWWPYFVGYAVLLLAPFAAAGLYLKTRGARHGYSLREAGAAVLFCSPWLIGFAVFVGGPILFSIVLSFTRYDVLSDARYVGLANYRDLLGDPIFFKSLGNTAYMLIRIPLVMAAGLAIALLLNRAINGIGVYRTAFYMPAIVPLVAASLLWIWLFNPNYGAINGVLSWIFDTWPFEAVEWVIGRLSGQPFAFAPPLWLQDADWSKPALIVMGLWSAGGGMVIWLAGLQSISPQLYEAAAIDGATGWRQFLHVTLPMLSPYVLFNLIVGVIGTMQIFGEAYIMTEGGPVDSTLFYAYYLFKQAFQFFRMGYASALAWILFLVVLALTLLQLWLSRRWVHYENA